MAQVFNKIYVDVRTKNNDIITAVQNDSNSRFLDVFLFDNGSPIDLTGHEVRIYGRKADGKEIYNNGTITEATNGRCQFELTDQALAVAQDLTVQIVIYYNNVQILQSLPFTIHVVESLISSGSVESSNEYGALVVLYQNLYESYDLMTTMVQNIGVPGGIASGLNIDTMWNAWEYMCNYLSVDISRMLQLALDNTVTGGAAVDDEMSFIPRMNWAPTIETGVPNLNHIAAENDAVYGVTSSNVLVKINPITMEQIANVSLGFTCTGIKVRNGLVYCNDNQNYKIVVYNAKTLDKVNETLAQSHYATQFSVDNDRVYYAQLAPAKIITFNAVTLEKIAETSVLNSFITGLDVYKGIIYCTVSDSKKITTFNALTLSKVNESTVQSGIMKNVKADKNGIFCVDATNNRIVGFSIDELIKNKETANLGGNIIIEIYGSIIYGYDSTSKKITAYRTSVLEGMGETTGQVNMSSMSISDNGVYIAYFSAPIKKATNNFNISSYARRDIK